MFHGGGPSKLVFSRQAGRSAASNRNSGIRWLRVNSNSGAEMLLVRDITNVCRHFARWGVESDPGALASDLWDRFLAGAL